MSLFTRQCPICNSIIEHKSERSYRQSLKSNLPCQSCAAKERVKKYGISSEFKHFTESGVNLGNKNPFYGKTHTEETKEKIKNRDKTFFKTNEYKQKLSAQCIGEKNPMYGKTYYQIWIQKYGKEKADELQKMKNKKTSDQCKGERNPMFGKPSPQGSGNGWKGWYKNWFFRSLKELSYVVNVLEVNNDIWLSAESENIKISYLDYQGHLRNYIPDFLVNQNILVEVKPTRLQSSLSVRLKQEAAELFCETKGWSYLLVDPPIITKDQLKKLIESNQVELMDRYKKMFRLREDGTW